MNNKLFVEILLIDFFAFCVLHWFCSHYSSKIWVYNFAVSNEIGYTNGEIILRLIRDYFILNTISDDR